MQSRTLTFSEIGLIAATRAAFGAGLGLLLAGKLSREARKGAGIALLTVGAISTLPIIVGILGKPNANKEVHTAA